MTTMTTAQRQRQQYAKDYQRGWAASERAADGALDRADQRGESDAWYDGYIDSATGRDKWTYRTWRANGCDSDCGFTCNGPHLGIEQCSRHNVHRAHQWSFTEGRTWVTCRGRLG